jgi:hypothetical protein
MNRLDSKTSSDIIILVLLLTIIGQILFGFSRSSKLESTLKVAKDVQNMNVRLIDALDSVEVENTYLRNYIQNTAYNANTLHSHQLISSKHKHLTHN